jgi:hypothetical protein
MIEKPAALLSAIDLKSTRERLYEWRSLKAECRDWYSVPVTSWVSAADENCGYNYEQG